MRRFQDESGVEWTVWVVEPTANRWDGPNRRAGQERRLLRAGSTTAAVASAERRGGRERREQALRAFRTFGGTLAHGWLAFQAGTERRRLSPIPPDWERAADAELAALCRRARPLRSAIAALASRGPERESA